VGDQRVRETADGIAINLQNGYVERLIRSIRREYLDHVIVLGEGHLRLNLSLDKDAPLRRPIQCVGRTPRSKFLAASNINTPGRSSR
jgi:hypothetical protein